jgi:hypothetical protein
MIINQNIIQLNRMASNADPAGIVLIKRAVELDENKRYAEALVCYREGIELLMDTFKSIS